MRKKLEKLEKKSKKNGKLTQKEEEIKEMVIEEIDYLESNAPRPLQIGVLETFVSDEELKRKQKKERLRLLKKKLEKLEKKSKKNGKLTQKEEEVKEMVIEKIDYLESNATPLLQIGTDMEGGKWKIKKDGKTTQDKEEKKGENHPVLSGEPLECGQVPPMRKRSPGAICNRKGYYVWGFVDGECQTFMRGSCGTKIPGFASKEKCQRACGPKEIELKKGQDYKCPTGNPYDCKL